MYKLVPVAKPVRSPVVCDFAINFYIEIFYYILYNFFQNPERSSGGSGEANWHERKPLGNADEQWPETGRIDCHARVGAPQLGREAEGSRIGWRIFAGNSLLQFYRSQKSEVKNYKSLKSQKFEITKVSNHKVWNYKSLKL